MAASPQFDIQPLGDSALIVEWRNISPADALPLVQSACRSLNRTLDPAIIESVPGFVSVTVHYDSIKANWPSMQSLVQSAVSQLSPLPLSKPRQLEIPVCYAPQMGPDLDRVSQITGLSAPQIIDQHASATYTVQLIGFAPGFCYLAGLPETLMTPRHPNPRLRVPAGSVGIGGGQTGIYPVEISGGWNIIGRTPICLFRADSEPPAVLSPGDRVIFRAIGLAEFESLRESP